MRAIWSRGLRMALLGYCLSGLLAACTVGSFVSSVGNAPDSTAKTVTPAAAFLTTCPKAGTARAAVMPRLILGNHPTIIYTFNITDKNSNPVSSVIKRYDVTTGVQSVIASFSHANVEGTQVSADGQWVLFSAHSATQSYIDLVRVDGQGLQTLFCTPYGGYPQWSTDEKHLFFGYDLLTLTDGSMEQMLNDPQPVSFDTWLDNSRIYLTNYQTDEPHNHIYILDIRKGPNQHVSSLTALVHKDFGDFDSSYDATRLYVDYNYPGQPGCGGPSLITAQPAAGGPEQPVLNEAGYCIIQVRAPNAHSLLFTINNSFPVGPVDTSRNGIWDLPLDSAGKPGTAIQVIKTPTGESSALNWSSQFPWSNVSRDSTLLAAGLVDAPDSFQQSSTALEYVPLRAHATPVVFASMRDYPGTPFNWGTGLDVAGWTTM